MEFPHPEEINPCFSQEIQHSRGIYPRKKKAGTAQNSQKWGKKTGKIFWIEPNLLEFQQNSPIFLSIRVLLELFLGTAPPIPENSLEFCHSCFFIPKISSFFFPFLIFSRFFQRSQKIFPTFFSPPSWIFNGKKSQFSRIFIPQKFILISPPPPISPNSEGLSPNSLDFLTHPEFFWDNFSKLSH